MRKQSAYRAIDLTLFALLLVLFESVIILASTRWFPGEPWTVSLTPALTAIVLIRWGPWGAVHAVLGGLVLCVLSGAAPFQYGIYLAGNLFALSALLLLPLFGGKDAITRGGLKACLWGLTVALLMQCGRALISLCFGQPLSAAAGFITTESVTDLFTALLLWIARRPDGLLADQLTYLSRLREEENQRRNSS